MLDDPLGRSPATSNRRWPPADVPAQGGPAEQNGAAPRSGAVPQDGIPRQDGMAPDGIPPGGVPSQYGTPVPAPRPRRAPMPEHVARLRAAVGHDLLLLPSVSVLPVDGAGRVMLARHTGFHDGWAALGGTVEVGESPAEAAVREVREETGTHIRLRRLLDVLGGPDFEVTYPNGDRAAYVTTVYEAEIVSGIPGPADGELSDLAWFSLPELSKIPLNRLTRALLSAIRAI